jgi:hypothetical protein
MEIDEEQGKEGFQAYRVDGEQVTGNDRCSLGPHELAPGVALWTRTPLWSDHPANARCRDLDAQLE